jgi:hypothetical protein
MSKQITCIQMLINVQGRKAVHRLLQEEKGLTTCYRDSKQCEESQVRSEMFL